MAIAGLKDVITNIAKGNCQSIPTVSGTSGTGTAAAAASGFFSLITNGNSIGATWPGTLPTLAGDLGANPAQSMFMVNSFGVVSGSSRLTWLARFYKLGVLDLTLTGDKFTHDAATFPVLRTEMGQASQPIDLIPIIVLTTATLTTAPEFILKKADGSAGYKNQSGTNVVGTLTHTLPAAATAVGSGFMLKLENGDSAVRDVMNIQVTTLGATGAADVWGMEYIAPMPSIQGSQAGLFDGVCGGLLMGDTKPAVATSGTATQFLGLIGFSNTGSAQVCLANMVHNI